MKWFIILSLILTLHLKGVAQTTQEQQLINALTTHLSTNFHEDSLLYYQSKEVLSTTLLERLSSTPYPSFKELERIKDSLSIDFKLEHRKIGSSYTLFTLRTNFSHWNYILKEKTLLLKEEDTFDYFYEVYDLDATHFLLIKRSDEMSFSCYEAYVYNTINAHKSKVLSVCSWTNIDGSYLEKDSLTGLYELKGGMKYYTPTPIYFDPKSKKISYTFIQPTDGKSIQRMAKYKYKTFKIKSFDVRTFLD